VVRGRRLQRWGILLLLLAGCAPSKVYVSKTYHTPKRVAVLPMSNETNDLDGPVLVRKLLQEHLEDRFFERAPLEEIDAALRDHGFTDGGQLRAAKPQDLGEWTKADGLLYSVLEEFNYLNVGFYWQRRVKIKARLVDAGTGESLWESEKGWITQGIATSKREAERQFAIQMAIKAAEKMTHQPLRPESLEAVYRLIRTLP